MTLVLCVVVIALAFEYVNGFHDTANAIATSIATKALTPTQAIMLSAFWNLIGAFMGTAVAKTIGSGLVDTNLISPISVACALGSGILWNLFTWYIGLPSSSSHALIGGLCGAALARKR
jgi:PiT family inorganic phosphate transporter